jgi:hypothetical protein
MAQDVTKSMKNWLGKPFPFYESYTQKVLIPVIPTLFVMIGLVLLNWTTNTTILWHQINSVLIYGSIVILISLLFSIVLPEIHPKLFNAEKWTVLKTLIFFLLTIVSVGIAITLFAYYFDNPNKLTLYVFLGKVMVRAVSLSFFPIIGLVFYFEIQLQKRNHSNAISIIHEIQKEKPEKPALKSQEITIAKNTKEAFSIHENDLFFIKAEGNYCKIFYKKESELKQKLIRSSLKEIEKCIQNTDTFIRCHKSYIINISKVSDVTGNARGYLFHFPENDHKIPGSRNLSKSVIAQINSHL